MEKATRSKADGTAGPRPDNHSLRDKGAGGGLSAGRQPLAAKGGHKGPTTPRANRAAEPNVGGNATDLRETGAPVTPEGRGARPEVRERGKAHGTRASQQTTHNTAKDPVPQGETQALPGGKPMDAEEAETHAESTAPGPVPEQEDGEPSAGSKRARPGENDEDPAGEPAPATPSGDPAEAAA